MREIVLPFTCNQVKWIVFIAFPIMSIYGLSTGDFLFIVVGLGVSIGSYVSQIMVWWADGKFNIRCKCDDPTG
jgi:hypothetical protein